MLPVVLTLSLKIQIKHKHTSTLKATSETAPIAFYSSQIYLVCLTWQIHIFSHEEFSHIRLINKKYNMEKNVVFYP